LLYEANKPAVFARCAELLKPGGMIVISDFCRGGTTTPEFEKYVDESGFHLYTIPAYADELSNAGFAEVAPKDISEMTGQHLLHDLDTYLAKAPDDPAIGDADVQHLTERWRRKIGFIEAGVLTQGMFRGVIPNSA
jgi:phosphoethanolamine N-methyltransferase